MDYFYEKKLMNYNKNLIDLFAFLIKKTLIEIFKVIHKTNLATLGISVVTMILLYLAKTFINEKFKHKLYVPIPLDLCVIILGTIISYYVDFGGRYNVKLVGELPAG